MNHQYTYQAALAASEKVRWRIEDVIGGERCLDFDKPFMPESLAQVDSVSFLTAHEKRTLNQIRGNGYLCIFGLVEEFILPFVLDHARPQLHGDDYRIRALLQFAGEEAKHIHLFNCFQKEFARGFGRTCPVIGPPPEIARAVLAHHPLAVAMVILQIEWMTQKHYVESVKEDQNLDAQFRSLLKHHWMEEAQHAKLDTLMIEALVESCGEGEIDRAIDDYFDIAKFLDGGLEQQVKFDLESFERAIGRSFSEEQRAELFAAQQKATRYTYIGSALQHPSFLETVGAVRPAARAKVEEVTPAFC